MVTFLLDRKKKKSSKKSRSHVSSSKGKGKEEGESSTSENTESENPKFEILESLSEEERNSESGNNHSKRMSELKKRLEALPNRSNL